MQTVQERGGAEGAQPPLNCLTHLNAALQCIDQAAISEMVEQEQWGAKGECSPPGSLSLHLVQLLCRRRLHPIFCDPQDHTLLVWGGVTANRIFLAHTPKFSTRSQR